AVASITPGAEVWITDMTNGVHVKASRPKYPAYIIGERFQFGTSERHVEQHVRIDAVERCVRERQRPAHIVSEDTESIADAKACCLVGQATQRRGRIVHCGDLKPGRQKHQSVPPLASAKLQKLM